MAVRKYNGFIGLKPGTLITVMRSQEYQGFYNGFVCSSADQSLEPKKLHFSVTGTPDGCPNGTFENLIKTVYFL